MINEKYAIAITETLHYLKGINQEDVNKIPKKFMVFLEVNAAQNYKCTFDYRRPLNELSLKDETRGLIAAICLNFWCTTEEQKKAFSKHLSENERRYQEELRKKYNIDDIFKKKSTISNVEKITENIDTNKLPISVEKENIFKRIINHIKKFFKFNT